MEVPIDEATDSLESINVNDDIDCITCPSPSLPSTSPPQPTLSSNQIPLNGQESSEIVYVPYVSENQLQLIMDLIDSDLSEPYSIYTYRYFLQSWPELSFLVSSILCTIL